MNRLWQLRETLPANLAALRGSRHFLALCDYNSGDGLEAFVRERFAADCERRNLLYFRTTTPARFQASNAKNTAHRLALTRSATVLFNLDADNFITPATLARVEESLASGRQVLLHEWSRAFGDGSFGRIALPAHAWSALGGYDESFAQMAWQDMDLLYRARAAGLTYRLVPGEQPAAIKNSLFDKLANTGLDVRGERGAHEQFQRLNVENLVRALGRPIHLPSAEQTRYAGMVNFDTPMVI
jgi:hypothetical protein